MSKNREYTIIFKYEFRSPHRKKRKERKIIESQIIITHKKIQWSSTMFANISLHMSETITEQFSYK